MKKIQKSNLKLAFLVFVRTIHLWLKRIMKLGFLLMMGVSMNADAGLFGGTNWKEEVLLHDGGKIIAKRSQSRGGRHEIGQSSPVKEHDITFTLSGSNQSITWKDEYSEDVGHSNFDLLALHILDGTPYLVASPFGCLSYNKWGRPNPPYVIFKYDGKAWNRISMVEFPVEFQTLNLVQDTDNNEKRLIVLGLVSAEQVKSFNRNYPQPEFKTILREPYSGAGGGCEELIKYKGYWIMPNDPVARGMVDRKAK